MKDYTNIGGRRGGSKSSAAAETSVWKQYRLLIIAAVVIVVFVAGTMFALNRADSSEASTTEAAAANLGAPHGPNKMVNKVIPAGYSHDRSGAATAATNFVQALSNTYQGRIKADDLRAAVLAANPSEALNKALGTAAGRPQTKDVFSQVPAAAAVQSYTENEAKIAIWAAGVTQSRPTPGEVTVQVPWSTTTITVTWQDDDWKVSDYKFEAGPEPGQVSSVNGGSPLAGELVAGYYSFYVN